MKRGRSRASSAKRVDEVAGAASAQKPPRRPGRDFEEVREKDPDGAIVIHHRTVDTLGKMLRSGTITQEMHDAAKDFQAAFIVANLDSIRALPILRVPGVGREPDLNERQLHARRRVVLNFYDFEHYRQTGRPSIGLSYEAWPMGPVPTDLDRELDAPGADIQSHVQIRRRRDASTGKVTRFDFKPIKSFDSQFFTKREMRLMRELALYFSDLRAEDMSEFSHIRGLPWREVYQGGTGRGQPIPYDLALKAQPLTDGGTIAPEELAYRREALRGLADVT